MYRKICANCETPFEANNIRKILCEKDCGRVTPISMFKRSCINCATVFETDNPRRTLCKKGCGRVRNNDKRREKYRAKTEDKRKWKEEHFPCGEPRIGERCKKCHRLYALRAAARRYGDWVDKYTEKVKADIIELEKHIVK